MTTPKISYVADCIKTSNRYSFMVFIIPCLGNIDNIIGYVHSFELFKKPKKIKQILLPISIVPEVTLIEELLAQFTKQKRSIAVVVDEFGGTSGLITVEDIIEDIEERLPIIKDNIKN